jgi:Mg-chelatase subunit ChlD
VRIAAPADYLGTFRTPERTLIAHLQRIFGAGAVLALLVAAWLLLPVEVDTAPPGAAVRVLVVDASASAVRRRPDWVPWARARLREEAEAAAAAGEEVALIGFAADVTRRFGPGAPEELLALLAGRDGEPLDPGAGAGRDAATRLADALRAASALATDPARRPGHVVLLGDGSSTGEDPTSALAALVRDGATLRHVPLPPATLPDLAVRSLALPAEVEEGAPLLARVELDYAPGLRLRGDDVFAVVAGVHEAFGVPRVFEQRVPLPPGGGALPVPIDLGPAGFGRNAVRLRAKLESGDPVPENDGAEASVVAPGETLVGVVSAAAGVEAARAWFEPGGVSAYPGLAFRFLAPAELPDELRDLDALVTFDVPLANLPGPLVDDFLRGGGGWLAVSGWSFLHDWAPRPDEQSATGLRARLPLVPAARDIGPRDVVLVVDGSGSMEGAPFDAVRAAALELVAAAQPEDEIRLRFFTAGLEEAHVVAPRGARSSLAEAKRAAARRLALRVPGGTTEILRSLDMLARARTAERREALVLLLTDGIERGAVIHPEAEAQRILADLTAARTQLRVIAVGDDPDLEFLGRLVLEGEELVRVDDLGDLEAVFRREVNRARYAAGAVRRARVEPGSLAAEVPVFAGAPPPPLARYVRDSARPGASVLLESEDGDPVLGVWRVGLGRTALLATCLRVEWAPQWAGEQPELGPRLRWLARDGAAARERAARARLAGDELVVRGLAEGFAPRLTARVVDPFAASGAGRVLAECELDPPTRAAGEDPRGVRRGPAPRALLEAPGGVPLALEVVDRGGGVRVLPLVRGLPPEFQAGAAALQRTEALTAAAAGPPASATGLGRREAREGGPLALGTGLALLFGSFLLRRSGASRPTGEASIGKAAAAAPGAREAGREG